MADQEDTSQDDSEEEGAEEGVLSTAESLPTGGGYGEKASSRRLRSNSDARLVMRAVRNKWPIPENKRQYVVDTMFWVLEHGEAKDKCSAARTLVSMEGQNMALNNEGQQSPITVNIRNAILQAGQELLPSPPPTQQIDHS
jgi:hypothetical protein